MPDATTTLDAAAIRRRIRRLDLGWEEHVFLRILGTLGVAAWCLVVWAWTIEIAPPAAREPVEVARVLLKPPPPPPPEVKEEPKPEPLPPRKETEKPKRAPVAKAKPPVVAAVPKAKVEPPRRSVASMGLLSMLSSAAPRAEASSQRIGQVLQNVDFRQARDLDEDVGTLTGSVGARDKASVSEMVAGLPRGSGTQVVLQGRVVSPIAGPGGPSVSSASGGGTSGRTVGEIRDIVAQYIPGLKYLYDRELKSRPELHGKLTVEFVVTADGGVSDVRLVSSALGHPSLEGAILGRIRGWKFPAKPADSTRVTFPFDFVAPAG